MLSFEKPLVSEKPKVFLNLEFYKPIVLEKPIVFINLEFFSQCQSQSLKLSVKSSRSQVSQSLSL